MLDDRLSTGFQRDLIGLIRLARKEERHVESRASCTLAFVHLPADHASRIDEIIKNESRQLTMYSKTSNTNDWSTMKSLHKSNDCLTCRLCLIQRVKRACCLLFPLLLSFFLLLILFARLASLYLNRSLRCGCEYAYVNDDDDDSSSPLVFSPD